MTQHFGITIIPQRVGFTVYYLIPKQGGGFGTSTLGINYNDSAVDLARMKTDFNSYIDTPANHLWNASPKPTAPKT